MLVKVQNTSFTLPGAEDQLTWSSPFTFALIADPQFGLYRNNNSWEEERQQVAECIIAAASLSSKPAFIAILGDLVHAPVPALSQESLQDEVRAVRDQQAKDLKDVIDKPSKDVPVLVLPGNHDVGNAPTAASIADYEQLWGKDHFSFWFGGVKFVAANSSVLYDDTNAKELAEEQFEWIENELKDGMEKGAKQQFLLQHHQFYWDNWGEADDKTNTVEVRQMRAHNPVSLFQLPKRWRERFQPLMKKYNVAASFHGHLHYDSLLQDGDTPQIVTSSCGFATNDGRPGWRLVTVEESKFSHEFYPVKWLTSDYPFSPPRFST